MWTIFAFFLKAFCGCKQNGNNYDLFGDSFRNTLIRIKKEKNKEGGVKKIKNKIIKTNTYKFTCDLNLPSSATYTYCLSLICDLNLPSKVSVATYTYCFCDLNLPPFF